ncbi:mammalian cell entry protein [Mycobacteroides saopaulense]|uniref:Mammalian cell entry protein n=2 Tax=Mycobacteroides saopaulense TaxID=1578165 RepID=A0ABX3BYY4_9MYCO|nr:MlaD family protein [Mycobacteroides saopaulense]ALR10747.1 mammalian cell entry protein [Mycobacteroides saopaulense]OHT81490.1 mammalian cell entry protein [Mycobacteroides saopaulense]OHU09018.1 mammalian cell entry protein [Mycobacteroides saopaulense]
MRMVRRREKHVLDDEQAQLRYRRTGVIGVLVIAAALIATGVAFVNPAGKATYTAQLNSSGGLRAGDEVRVAGIPVGKVLRVHVTGAVVEAKFAVEETVKVGSESRIDVKLLTPLGGHYLALSPKGSIPLGQNPIPPEHASVPFEINDIFQQFTPLVEKVDGQTIHDTYVEIADAAHAYPDSLRDFFRSTRTLIHTLSQSSDDYRRDLNYINEYGRAFASGGDQVAALLNQFAVIGRKYTPNSVDIVELFTQLAELSRMLDRIGIAYERDFKPMLNGIDDIFDTLFAYPEKVGQAADQLGQIVKIVGPMLSGNGITINEGDRVIPGQDICLPHFFRQC